MAKQVTIIYNGPAQDIEREGQSICPLFVPAGSYVDSKVYKEGLSAEATVDEQAVDVSYGKSIYATNVEGWGSLPGLLPIASAPIKFAYFERAIAVAKAAKESGSANNGVVVAINNADEELYWNQMAPHFIGSGFTVTIAEAAAESDNNGGDTEGATETTTETNTETTGDGDNDGEGAGTEGNN